MTDETNDETEERVDTREVEQRLSDLLDACLKEVNEQIEENEAMRRSINAGRAHLAALEMEAVRLRLSMLSLTGAYDVTEEQAREVNVRRLEQLRGGIGVE